MLVYGDPWRMIDVAHWRARAATQLAGTPVERRAELRARLIEGGQLLQALEDAAFESAGQSDHDDAGLAPLRHHLLQLGRALVGSDDDPVPAAPDLPENVPAQVLAREPEGYAFYALYPEAYAAAAARLGPLPAALVIGLRSIGASLAPVVAAAIGARSFVTLRPIGPAFDRRIEAPDLALAIARRQPRDVLIVDEGPGLSGSSFASVARFVRTHAPQSRIVLAPSHAGGPGGEASAETRALFATAPQAAFCFDETLHAELPGWVAGLTGPATAPLEPMSGGLWRQRRYAGEADWPAADVMQERLKFLLRTERGVFHLKFVGLGDIGERKARMAASLGRAQLAPKTLGYRNGFVVERWIEAARPLDMLRDRAAFLPALATYLAFRQAHFACPDGYGASVAELQLMASRNAGLALGEAAGEIAAERLDPLVAKGAVLRKVATDNRMHVHEWLVAPGGRFLKTDGVDHHAGHDLVGAQDILFDVAAACLEYDLTPAEAIQLCRSVESESGHSVDASLLAPMRIAWLAFEIGRMTFAENSCAAGAEAGRLRARRLLLESRLKRELASPPGSPDRELQSHTVVSPA